MKHVYQSPRSIALILSDDSAKRLALPVALELDERLESKGIEVRIFDLSDHSYDLAGLADFEGYIFVSGDTMPGYPPEVTNVLIPYMDLWEGRQVGVVRVAENKLEAEMADRYLFQLVKHMGIGRLSRLVVLEPEFKFDKGFNLTNPVLEEMFEGFLKDFTSYVQEEEKQLERRLTA